MTFSAFCQDYLLLGWLMVGGMSALLGAVSVWAWMRWRYQDGIAVQLQFDKGLFKC